MAKIISVTNQKGGVGKTSTASALVSGLHESGYKVLAVDLDPQGNLGFCLGADIETGPTVHDLMKGTQTAPEVIQECGGIHVIPSNILLSGAELEFSSIGREYLLKNGIAPIAENYDFIIIDTPPALNVLTVNAYTATDSLIIPMVPEILSLLGISQLRETVELVRRYYNPELRVLGILLNKYDKRRILTRDVSEMAGIIAGELGTVVFDAKIRPSVAVAEAPAHGASIYRHAARANSTIDYRSFINELLEREGMIDNGKENQ